MFDRLPLSILHEISTREISSHKLLACSKAFHIYQGSQPAQVTIVLLLLPSSEADRHTDVMLLRRIRQ